VRNWQPGAPYATVFNNHSACGALAITGAWQLFQVRNGPRHAYLAGLCFALAASVDITFFVFLAIALLPVAVVGRSPRNVMWYALGAAPIVVVYFVLNVAVSGSLVPPAMNATLWNYPGSWFDAGNLSGVAHHQGAREALGYAFDLLLGAHGLFSYTPLLFFSVYAFVLLLGTATPYRIELAALGAACFVYVGACVVMSTTASGDSYGCAWWSALMPVAFLPIAALEPVVTRDRRLRVLFCAAVVVSIAVAWLGVVFPFTKGNGVIYNLGLIMHGRHAHGWLPIVALGLGVALACALVFCIFLNPKRLAANLVRGELRKL
jgi:hypothetical protein